MLEYKRDNQTLELRLGELLKRSEHYDDHLRIIDAWWLQVILYCPPWETRPRC